MLSRPMAQRPRGKVGPLFESKQPRDREVFTTRWAGRSRILTIGTAVSSRAYRAIHMRGGPDCLSITMGVAAPECVSGWVGGISTHDTAASDDSVTSRQCCENVCQASFLLASDQRAMSRLPVRVKTRHAGSAPDGRVDDGVPKRGEPIGATPAEVSYLQVADRASASSRYVKAIVALVGELCVPGEKSNVSLGVVISEPNPPPVTDFGFGEISQLESRRDNDIP